MGDERQISSAEVFHIAITANETHVWCGRNETSGVGQGALRDQIRPELTSHLKLLIDRHRSLDFDRAVGSLRCVVEFSQCRVASTRVIPRIGAFPRDPAELLENTNIPIRFELFEQGAERRAHYPTADKYHVESLAHFVSQPSW